MREPPQPYSVKITVARKCSIGNAYGELQSIGAAGSNMMKPVFANHSTVNHGKKEYSRKEESITVTTNTVEGYFALLKRSVYGVHHHWDRKYIGSYCAERDFVYNNRKITDDKRTDKALKGAHGRRLMLNKPKNG